MTVEMVKMSSKGQIVIPKDIRAEIRASEGTMFAVVSGRGSIVLKKVATPSKEELICELREIAKEGKKRLEAEISSIVEKSRRR